MPAKGFDYRRRRPWLAWGAEREWPPLNPIPSDPNTYVYISSEHTTDPPPDGGTSVEISSTHVSTSSYESMWLDVVEYFGSAWSSGTWTANLAAFVPIVLPAPLTIKTFYWINGATAAGNSEACVLNAAGTSKLAATGAVANAGTTTLQVTSITPVELPDNVLLWLSYACDSGTHTLIRSAPTRIQMVGGIAGYKQDTAGYSGGLTVPATFNDPTLNVVPFVGMSSATAV